MLENLCTVDWPAVVSCAKDVVVAVAAIVTATVACIGISKWRAEESGKADFDLARRLGTAIYRFRDALALARAPFVQVTEFPNGKMPEPGDNWASAYASVFNQRFQGVRQSANDLDALRNEAEALWGKEIATKLSVLVLQSSILHVAMQKYINSKRNSSERDPVAIRVVEARVFDSGNEVNDDGTEGAPNEFTVKIEQAVEDVAAYLRTKLPHRPRPAQLRD